MMLNFDFMKVCSRCNKVKEEREFRKQKGKSCVYLNNVCRECENASQRLRDKERRLTDENYVKSRRDSLKKYQQTQKGKANKLKQQQKYRERHKEYYIKNNEKCYRNRLRRLKKEITEIADEYIITQLQNPHRKQTYTREYLKLHPEIIEAARIKILQKRVLKKISELSDFGICIKCKKSVPKSEFKVYEPTENKKGYTKHICKVCAKELSKINWQKHKLRQNEKHNNPSQPSL